MTADIAYAGLTIALILLAAASVRPGAQKPAVQPVKPRHNGPRRMR